MDRNDWDLLRSLKLVSRQVPKAEYKPNCYSPGFGHLVGIILRCFGPSVVCIAFMYVYALSTPWSSVQRLGARSLMVLNDFEVDKG